MEKYVIVNNQKILVDERFIIEKNIMNYTFIFEIQYIDDGVWEVYIASKLYGIKRLVFGAEERFEFFVNYINENYIKHCLQYIEDIFEEEE